MTSLSVIVIVYYNDTITITKHGSTFVSSSPKIVQLDNKVSLDASKQAIGNKISLLNGKVVMYIHFLCPVSFVGDCFQYRACMLQDDEEIITMFSIFGKLFNFTCLEFYVITVDTPT